MKKCDDCERQFKNESFATAQQQLRLHRGIVHSWYSGGLSGKKPNRSSRSPAQITAESPTAEK